MTSATKSDDPFSSARVKRNLAHFAIGKFISAVLNLGLLLLVVRTLPVAEYGIYITLLALLEIAILLSDGGANGIAQRYISEARLPANLGSLPRLVWGAIAYRLLTLLLVGSVLAVFTIALLQALNVSVSVAVFHIYLIAIVFEGLCRYTDWIFDALLEQRLARISVVFRTGGKLLGVLGVIALHDELRLQQLVVIEGTVALLAACLSVVMLAGLIRRLPPPQSAPPTGHFSLRRMGPFALQIYLAQCVGLLYGPNAVKLVVTRLLGPVQAAVFGFAHSITFLLQQYLPSQLLAGLVRPVLVTRRARGGGDKELADSCNLILKINHFLIVPIIAFFAVQGSQFAAWLSDDKYISAGRLLFWLSALLVVQSLHFVLSLLTVALGHRSAIFWGTLAAVPGIAMGITLLDRFGSLGMVAGLWLSELLWCATTWGVLFASGFTFRLDGWGWMKIGGCGLVSAMAGYWVSGLLGGQSVLALACSLLTVLAGYVLTGSLVKPFNDSERARINRLLPKPWFIF